TQKHVKSTISAGTHPWLLNQVLNSTVKDLQGDTLGQLQDVVIDPVSGRATFAIIKLSGEVGPAGVYAPVPWKLLNPTDMTDSTQPKTLTLNIDKNQFASAQRFFLNQWPDYNEASWGPKVYSYYGLDPASAGFAVGATGSGTITDMVGDYRWQGMGAHGPTRLDATPIDTGTAPDG